MKRTPWFSAMAASPARVGWYECRNSSEHGDGLDRRYWNGQQWSALGRRDELSLFGMVFRSNQWRGLATKP